MAEFPRGIPVFDTQALDEMESWTHSGADTQAFVAALAELTDWHDAAHVTRSDASPVAVSALDGSTGSDGACGDDGTSLVFHSSDDASSTAPAKPARSTRKKRVPGAPAAPRSVNLSRERRKKEIASLKRMVFDLQGELKQLQQRREEMLRQHLAEGTGELISVAPVWEGMAKRQFRARRKAEMEMARLKVTLTVQAQIAEDLVNAIERAQSLGQQEISSEALMPSPVVADMSVEMQLERLNILCGQWFVALSWHSDLHNRQLNFLESKVISDDGTETVLDIYSNQAFPFTVAQVEEAIWAVFHAEYAEDEYAYKQNFEATNDTLVSKFKAASKRAGSQGTLGGAYVTRRFRNHQGHFMMASNVYASFGSDQDTAQDDGYVLTEDTWVRVLDAREMTGVVASFDASTPLTVLQHVRRSRIRYTKMSEEGGASRVEGLMMVHLALVEEGLRWGQLSIESMLMRGVC